MGLLDDILKAFDRWDEGKRMRATPDRVDALEKRVADLEEKLGDEWPPDICKFCGERAARLNYSSANDKGKVVQRWRCGSCNSEEVRIV